MKFNQISPEELKDRIQMIKSLCDYARFNPELAEIINEIPDNPETFVQEYDNIMNKLSNCQKNGTDNILSEMIDEFFKKRFDI